MENISSSVKHATPKDKRTFFTDVEFEKFKNCLEFSFFEAAKLIPEFNPEKQAMTSDQARELLPFLYQRFTPYSEKMDRLSGAISQCVDKNAGHQP
jgi:hypothetical protein